MVLDLKIGMWGSNTFHPIFFPTGLLSAIDIVEVNPKLAKKEEEAQLTASVAVDLVLGCFGRVREGSHRDDYKIPEP